MRRLAPSTSARTACKFTFQRRLVTLWAWLMRLPNWGPRPQISQTFAMMQNSPQFRISNYINAVQYSASTEVFGRPVAAKPPTGGTLIDPATILVVEDVESIRRMVCAMLSQLGYSCLEAEDGTEAVRLVREHPVVTLVITDMIMPQMSGAQLACHLAIERPDIRLIFMSGFSDDPVVQALEHSPTYFLAKPFTAGALIGKVREALSRPWKGLPDEPARALFRSGVS
jgi:CheY-like chemotaxis protein